MNAHRWHRAAEVFEATLDQPEGERHTYVQKACAGDSELLREVEALIDADRHSCAVDNPLSPAVIADLSSIKNVGPYRVLSLLGVGGMGEVYRARDDRLGRDVAIKLLPALFASDADRLARFKREAQVLASLNHPNIAAIYGFEAHDGVDALVLELVEGPTLADRLQRGALSFSEAVSIARQIADALAAAHEAGVVHRDLKPSNVKLREDGTVKVLDFGLAKMVERDRPGAASPMASPTITSPAMTAAGIILGTAAYMSPEQAKGKPADQRSDIWAFGCVLYEMLTARRAFAGNDVSDTLAAILKSEPDWTALGHDTPAAVRRVLRRCLEKDPGQRYHAIADARLDLVESTTAPDATAVEPWRLHRERVVWALLAATLLGGVIYLASQAPPPPAPTIRFQVAPPAQAFFGSIGGLSGGMSHGTISPDGTRLAFIATEASGRTSLWVRPLDSNAARTLADTDNATQPFWSPDGRSIGFFAAGQLKILDLATGAVRAIADAFPGRGGSWGSRNVIVFSQGNPARLARVSPDGGVVTPILTGDDKDGLTRQPVWPRFMPDGQHFLYWARTNPDGAGGIVVASIDAAFTPRLLVQADTAGGVMPPNVLLFARRGIMLQQRLDLNRLEVSGEAIPINEQVRLVEGNGFGDFTASAGGALVYQAGPNLANQFAWVDRAGQTLQTIGVPGQYRTSALSPDGKRLAYEDRTKGDIWVLDLERQIPSRFTSSPVNEACPVWFPDGTKIVYRSDSGGVFEKDASGTTGERRLLDVFINGPSQVTNDGKWILYFFVPPGGQSQDIAVLPTSGDRTPRTIVASPFADVEPQISPHGRWLAYASTETGRNEIYVQPFPPTGARWQISSAGGRQPQWRADGKELFFVADDRRFYSVDVGPSAETFDYGAPRFLFNMRANVFNVRNSYIPSPDGQRFLVTTLLDQTGEPLNVILNWKPR